LLDHDHSAYVDQWDWERVITAEQRNLPFLKAVVSKIWKVLVGAEKFAIEMFPKLKDPRYPTLPEELIFLHAEEILEMYPDLPRKQRETQILQKYPAIFIIGIGWPLKDGYPHEMRAADYDDRVTDTSDETGRYPRIERRHSGVESSDQAASRVEFDGRPGNKRDVEKTARTLTSTRLSAAALSPRDTRRSDSPFNRRRHRTVAYAYVAFAEGSLG
jgi:hypothetical protein